MTWRCVNLFGIVRPTSVVVVVVVVVLIWVRAEPLYRQSM